MVQIHPSLFEPSSEIGGRRRGNTKFEDFTNSELIDTKQQEDLQNVLFSVYKIHKEKFIEWQRGKKLTESYIKDTNNVIVNTLKLKFNNVLELRDELTKVKNRKYRALALRNLFNFCDEYEILDNDLLLRLKSKIKITERSNIDSFIPSEDQIIDFLDKLSKYDSLSYLFVKILLESGLRVSEVKYIIHNVDENKFEINENIVVYPLYYLRGTKSSYYAFMSKETYLQILDNKIQLTEFNVEKLKSWIKRHNYLSLKYTRKFNFTKLIKAGINLETANFIQGRVSQNIGFNHYLAKKEIAVKEYEKLIIFSK